MKQSQVLMFLLDCNYYGKNTEYAIFSRKCIIYYALNLHILIENINRSGIIK